MRLLLDTQLLVSWLLRAKRVPVAARELIENASFPVLMSRASLWEIAIKISLKKLEVDLPRFIRNAEATGFEWLDIENEHLLAVAALPVFDDHKDPLDQLLVAQSLAEPLILLTTNAKLARCGSTVRVIV